MYITALGPEHATQAARLHIAGQPGTFLTELGPDVLSTVYRLLPQSRHGYGCVALADSAAQPARAAASSSSLLGFVAATTSIGDLFIEMGAKQLALLVPPLFKRFARRPHLFWRSLQTLLYPFLVREPDAQPLPNKRTDGVIDRPAELLSIMVAPEQRDCGIGSLLVQMLVEITRWRKLAAIHVTVDAHNLGAQRFYLRHAFVQVRTFSLYGRPMCLYQRDLW